MKQVSIFVFFIKVITKFYNSEIIIWNPLMFLSLIQSKIVQTLCYLHAVIKHRMNDCGACLYHFLMEF